MGARERPTGKEELVRRSRTDGVLSTPFRFYSSSTQLIPLNERRSIFYFICFRINSHAFSLASLTSPMSSLHFPPAGHTISDSSDDLTPPRARLPPSLDTNVDPDVVQRIEHMSLSHARATTDEDSSQSPSDLVSILDSAPLSPGSESITSFDFDRNTSSDQLSSLSPQPSLYSLTDSLKEHAIRWEYGRGVNTHSEVYKLAADEEEALRQGRLSINNLTLRTDPFNTDKQHLLYKTAFGDYAPPFREVLEDNNDLLLLNPKTCLDVGCGSGAWSVELTSHRISIMSTDTPSLSLGYLKLPPTSHTCFVRVLTSSLFQPCKYLLILEVILSLTCPRNSEHD